MIEGPDSKLGELSYLTALRALCFTSLYDEREHAPAALLPAALYPVCAPTPLAPSHTPPGAGINDACIGLFQTKAACQHIARLAVKEGTAWMRAAVCRSWRTAPASPRWPSWGLALQTRITPSSQMPICWRWLRLPACALW